ncbi:MAG TPA: PKD domain-containing protein [Candidatus Thermoplasmatota archaeon]
MASSRAARLVAIVTAAAAASAGCLGAPGALLNSPPVAAFALSSDLVAIGEAVLFDASASSDPDGELALYQWNFGDGAAATGVTASHMYAAAGTYTVSLTVHDPEGLQNADVQNVTVNAPPTASFSMSDGPYFAKEPIEFDALDSRDPDGRIAAYAWDFGDGQVASEARVSHEFQDTGTFTVALRVTDDHGASDAKNVPIFVDLHTYAITFEQQGSQLPPIRNFTLANQTKTTTVEVFLNNLTRANFTLTWRDPLPVAGVPNDVLELRVTSPEGSLLTARGTVDNVTLSFNLNPVPADLQVRAASAADAVASLGGSYVGTRGTGVWVVEVVAVELGGGIVDGGFAPQPLSLWTLNVSTHLYAARATEIG